MKTKFPKLKQGGLIAWMHACFLLLFVCITIVSMVDTKTVWWVKLSLVVLLLTLFYIRHYVSWAKKCKLWRNLSPIVEVLLILPLSLMTTEGLPLWFVMIIVIDIILDYESKYSIVFSIIGYLVYITFLILKVVPVPIFQVIAIFIVGALQYTIVMSAGFFAKRYYLQNIQNKELMAKQKVQMLELEEMAILKERNRIAGQIHDTVGHQLTTALVQMEAVSMLIDNDLSQAKRRLHIVRDQVKMGLNELRSSVKQLKDESFSDYNAVLSTLVERVKSTTGVDIITDFNGIDVIPSSHKKTIYYMSMEAITNAIRHGRCENIWWCINVDKDSIVVAIENDGIIPDKITRGFGLDRINEEVKKFHGKLWDEVGEHGFRLVARIDISKGEVI